MFLKDLSSSNIENKLEAEGIWNDQGGGQPRVQGEDDGTGQWWCWLVGGGVIMMMMLMMKRGGS